MEAHGAFHDAAMMLPWDVDGLEHHGASMILPKDNHGKSTMLPWKHGAAVVCLWSVLGLPW